MSEMIELAYDSAKEDMQKAMDRLDMELRKIRAGKAHPSMLDLSLIHISEPTRRS